MLRTIFVGIIIVIGGISAFRGPFYALLFYLWYAYFRPEQWLWTDFVSQLNLSLLTGALLLGSSLFVLETFRWTRQAGVILLMLIHLSISALVAEHPDWSGRYWIEFSKVLIVSFVMTFVVDSTARIRLVLLVVAYSLGLEAAKQGWAQLMLNPGAQNNNTHPLLGDNNGVAVGMMMLLPILGALAATATNKWEKWTHHVFTVGLLYRGLATYSRGGLLAGLVVATAFVVRSTRKFRMLVVSVALLSLLAAVMPSSYWERMQTITAPSEERDSSAQGRLFFWSAAIQMAWAKPLTGVGPNGFSQSFSSYEASAALHGGQRAVHSAWFGALADLGFPGLVLLLAAVWGVLSTCRRIRRVCRQRSDLAELGVYAAALEVTFYTYIVGATFINAHYNEMFWQLVGLVGAIDMVSRQAESVPQPSPTIVPTPAVPGVNPTWKPRSANSLNQKMRS